VIEELHRALGEMTLRHRLTICSPRTPKGGKSQTLRVDQDDRAWEKATSISVFNGAGEMRFLRADA